MRDQQLDLERRAGELSLRAARGSRSAARATASASIGSDLPKLREPLARAGHQLWRDAHDAFAVLDQKTLQRSRDVAAVLEREEALIAKLTGPLQELLVAGLASGHGELVHQLPDRGSDGNCCVGLLVGVDPDYDHVVPFRI